MKYKAAQGSQNLLEPLAVIYLLLDFCVLRKFFFVFPMMTYNSRRMYN